MAACNAQKQKKSKEKEKRPCIPPDPVITNTKETINEATLCSACTKRLVSPKLLPCFHTICLPCLKRRCRGKTHGDFTKCPICYNKFIILDKGVDNFQPDFLAEFLLQAEDAPEKEKRTACESCPAECDGLPIEVPSATSYCMDCFMKLCEGCSKPHARLRGKNHRILTFGKDLEQRSCHKQPSGQMCHKPSSGQACGNHSNHTDSQHQKSCFDCQVNICEVCQTCKYGKAQDMCKQISDMVKEFMQQLEEDIENIRTAISTIQGEISRRQKEKNSFVEELAKTEAAIVCKGDEIKTLVDMEVDSMLEELASIKAKSLEKLAWAVQAGSGCILSMRGFQNYAQLVKTEGTPYIISRVATELNMHSRASFLLKWQQSIKSDNHRMPKIVFTGADAESYFHDEDKGSLIGKLECHCQCEYE